MKKIETSARRVLLSSALLLSVMAGVGCDSKPKAPAAAPAGDLVWAVNVGGPAYLGIDGTRYDAEASVRGGTIGKMTTVKGSQDPLLYQSYREGDVEVAHPIANGSYDITFHFAEPEQFGRGERIFDALIEGQRVIEDLDVMLARDSKVESALTVAIPDVRDLGWRTEYRIRGVCRSAGAERAGRASRRCTGRFMASRLER